MSDTPRPARKRLIVRTFMPRAARSTKPFASTPPPALRSPSPPRPQPAPTSAPASQAKAVLPMPDPVRARRRDARLAARAWLRATWNIFAGQPTPLAIGITRTIVDHPSRPDGVSRTAIAGALQYHVQGRLYLKALASDGAMRHSLEGEPVAPVSDEDRANARERYEKIYGEGKV
jgi:hypothetical protein